MTCTYVEVCCWKRNVSRQQTAECQMHGIRACKPPAISRLRTVRLESLIPLALSHQQLSGGSSKPFVQFWDHFLRLWQIHQLAEKGTVTISCELFLVCQCPHCYRHLFVCLVLPALYRPNTTDITVYKARWISFLRHIQWHKLLIYKLQKPAFQVAVAM